MKSNRRTAWTAGILFILATVANVVGTQLSQPILSAPDYLTGVSANANLVTVGALLELIAAGACAGIAVSLYPVLRDWNPALALGSVVFRTIEAVMYTVGVVGLLSLLALSRQYAGSGAPDLATLRLVGYPLLSVRDQVTVPAVLAFSAGALMYYVVFYQSRLIPRWLSGWGIVAIILMTADCLFAWFSHSPLTAYMLLVLPIAAQEMVLALWLITRGFSSTAGQPKTNFRVGTAAVALHADRSDAILTRR